MLLNCSKESMDRQSTPDATENSTANPGLQQKVMAPNIYVNTIKGVCGYPSGTGSYCLNCPALKLVFNNTTFNYYLCCDASKTMTFKYRIAYSAGPWSYKTIYGKSSNVFFVGLPGNTNYEFYVTTVGGGSSSPLYYGATPNCHDPSDPD